jgi:AAA15 family ATPase/GTPase
MNALLLKASRIEVEKAKSARDIAQLDYDTEVKIYDQYEQQLYDAFHKKIPMDMFLDIRNMKRIQARIVRDAHNRLIAATIRLDNAETDHDIAFNAVHQHYSPAEHHA